MGTITRDIESESLTSILSESDTKIFSVFSGPKIDPKKFMSPIGMKVMSKSSY